MGAARAVIKAGTRVFILVVLVLGRAPHKGGCNAIQLASAQPSEGRVAPPPLDKDSLIFLYKL